VQDAQLLILDRQFRLAQLIPRATASSGSMKTVAPESDRSWMMPWKWP